jgi:type IV pilus assembly protein PilX
MEMNIPASTSSISMPALQKGMVLITGLIFMVVLTLIVLASMRGSILDEKMAGNTRSQNLAFQAAEAGLRAGEQALDSAVDPATGPGYFDVGVVPTGVASTDDWKTFDWSTAANPGLVYLGVDSVQYVIEKLSLRTGTGGNNDVGYTPQSGNPRDGLYRITARAIATGNAPVILQSIVNIEKS